MTEKDAMLRLSALCSQAEHCTYEMKEKMQRWDIPDDAQDRIVEYLVSHKFVDDERFARYFVIDKIRYNKWGRRKVEQALWAKHIDDDIKTAVLDEINDDEYVKVLRPLLQSKSRSIKASSDYERRMKLIRFAMGRGFTMDIINRCLDVDDDSVTADENLFSY